MAVGQNIIFDPTKEEVAVADSILAISVGDDLPSSPPTTIQGHSKRKDRNVRILAIRTIDPPARLTPPGVPDALNTAAGGGALKNEEGVWVPPRGGMKRNLVRRMVEMVVREGGVAAEVLDGLEGVDVG